jgi:hypothetical protein
MRKVALLAAVVLSVSFANTSTSIAAGEVVDLYKLNINSHNFVRDAWMPYAATAKAAAPAKAAKKTKKKKKKGKR